MKNLVIADHSYSLENILNFPFALGSFERRTPNSEGAIATMMNGRIIRANQKHYDLIKKLVISIGVEEQIRTVEYLEGSTDILMYEPRPYDSDNAEELVVPDLVVRFPYRQYENPDETLNIIEEMTISFWEHPALVRVPGWLLRGRYYGYPDCCIQTFIDNGRNSHTNMTRFLEVRDRAKDHPCIVCDEHFKMTPDEVVDIVMQKRHAPFPIDSDEVTPAERMVSTLEYLLALQEGKLTTRYSLEDPC